MKPLKKHNKSMKQRGNSLKTILKNSNLPSCKVKTGKIFILFFVCLSLVMQVGCGRKPKNILAFGTTDRQQKKTKYIFYPTIKNIELTPTNIGINLSWKPIEHEHLEGYNVYRFSRTTFIPKNPLNKTPMTTTTFTDSHPPKTYVAHYVIRAVFKKENKHVEGPTSQIVFWH